jgi:large subunit ribosomal protein L30
MKRIAIIQVRGAIGMKKKVKDTLKFLRLFKKNCCSVVSNTYNIIGMLRVVKDYVTWGEIDKETFKLLLEKRGRLPGNKALTENYLKEKIKMDFDKFAEEFMSLKKDLKDVPGLKKFFRLKPPMKGYGREGIKKPYSLGGALGYRKDTVNDLIRRML